MPVALQAIVSLPNQLPFLSAESSHAMYSGMGLFKHVSRVVTVTLRD